MARIFSRKEHTSLEATPLRLDPPNGCNDGSDCVTDVCAFLARSIDEVHPKHLSVDERVAFEAADAAEWKAIVESSSVKVMDSVAADAMRRERPDRVINSRLVRRLKPQEGTFLEPKAKSRWCVLGHQDPDATHTTDGEHHAFFSSCCRCAN